MRTAPMLCDENGGAIVADEVGLGKPLSSRSTVPYRRGSEGKAG
jgi:hypothetical protein